MVGCYVKLQSFFHCGVRPEENISCVCMALLAKQSRLPTKISLCCRDMEKRNGRGVGMFKCACLEKFLAFSNSSVLWSVCR